MKTKLESIISTDPETDTQVEIPMAKYVKAIIKEYDVPELESENAGVASAQQIVESVIKSVTTNRAVSDELQSEEYSDVIERITQDVTNTKQTLVDNKDKEAKAKEDAKEAKEKVKKEKEAVKAKLAKRQDSFIEKIDEGSKLAADDFLSQLAGVKEKLPKSISIQQSGNGFGIALDQDVSDEDLGVAIGYFQGASDNSEAFGNQVQFFIGDLASAAVARGVFNTAIDASKSISAHLETKGKRIAPGAIDTYRRMSERTPVEMRNPKADPTAYLEMSRMKRPKKGDNESKEDFTKRTEAFESDINTIQEELRDGKKLTRKDVVEPVQELKYKHGIEERPDPNNKPVSTTDLLKMFFLGSVAIDKLVGNYKDEDGKIVEDQAAFVNHADQSIVWVSETDLETMVEEAKSQLMNIYMKGKNHEVKDMLRGYKVEKKDVATGTDADGKAMTEKRSVNTPVYLPTFFDVEAEEATQEEGEAAK